MEARLHNKPKAPPESFTTTHHGVLQRKCACGGASGMKGECEECDKQKLSLQRSAMDSERTTPNSDGVPSIVYDVLGSPGQPLDTRSREFFEPRFGHDFSKVRVHTDQSASESASQVNALAYTVGSNIVFGTGQFAPGTAEGRRLLAHELTHVAQQGNQIGMQRSLEVGPQADAFERQADEIATQVCSPESFGGARPFSLRAGSPSRGPIIQRAIKAPAPAPAPAPPVPEPPVDCTKEITPDHDCAKLIAEMIALAADIRENDRYLDALWQWFDEEPQSVPFDVLADRLKLKGYLEKEYGAKNRIRLACCPTFEVPPEAPTYVSPEAPAAPQAPAGPAPP